VKGRSVAAAEREPSGDPGELQGPVLPAAPAELPVLPQPVGDLRFARVSAQLGPFRQILVVPHIVYCRGFMIIYLYIKNKPTCEAKWVPTCSTCPRKLAAGNSVQAEAGDTDVQGLHVSKYVFHFLLKLRYYLLAPISDKTAFWCSSSVIV